MREMLDRISQLEAVARRLDPEHDRRSAWFAQVGDYAESFLRALPTTPTYAPDAGRNPFDDYPLQDEAAPIEELLEFYRGAVDTTGVLPASGGQLGYIPGGGLFPSALGDFLAGTSNRYSGVAFAGPGAARMEGALVDWMCGLVGYPRTAAGDLTSGGSTATLSALVVARDAHDILPDRIAVSCIYLTGQAHHCIGKALHVAGLGQVRKRLVPMDHRYRMNVPALSRMIDEDRNRGLYPWLVIASAGTTDTGAVDPIGDIAAIAEREQLWFHLDAAYGGFFLLCEEGRERLQGIGLADSIVMDPHKGLGIPYGSGAALVRRGDLLSASFSYYADYMQDAKRPVHDADAPYSPADHSLELTRPFRGPRMWFPLKLFGLAPFRAALAEKIWLARYFHAEISRSEWFEAGPGPDLSIVTFRCRPGPGDADAEASSRRLLQKVHEDGRFFLTSTQLDGKFTLRLAVLNFRTHRDTIDRLLDLLFSTAETLQH